jgi:hypothetical protein
MSDEDAGLVLVCPNLDPAVRTSYLPRRSTYGSTACWRGPPRPGRRRSSWSGPMLAVGATAAFVDVEVAASPPAVCLGSELAFQLHQAPDPGAVGAELGLDLGGRLTETWILDSPEDVCAG